MSGSDHYFSTEPGSGFVPREISVHLAGSALTVTTAPGVFSPDHVDTGTEVLLAHSADPPPGGDILDVGCGWGPIALSIAMRSPRARVWAIDVNPRALELVQRNADSLGLTNITTSTPDHVPTDLRVTGVWSNPPIRVGKPELHAILERWLPLLEPGHDAWLVAAKHLGADSLQRWIAQRFPSELSVTRAATHKGFRVLRARRQSVSVPS